MTSLIIASLLEVTNRLHLGLTIKLTCKISLSMVVIEISYAICLHRNDLRRTRFNINCLVLLFGSLTGHKATVDSRLCFPPWWVSQHYRKLCTRCLLKSAYFVHHSSLSYSVSVRHEVKCCSYLVMDTFLGLLLYSGTIKKTILSFCPVSIKLD